MINQANKLKVLVQQFYSLDAKGFSTHVKETEQLLRDIVKEILPDRLNFSKFRQ